MTIPQLYCGPDPYKGSEKVLGGGHTPQSRGRSGVDWGLIGDSNRDTVRYTRGLLNTEAVLSTCTRAAATPPRTYL